MIDETAEEIAEMQTHSSSVVATKAARALAELTEREYATVEEYEQNLERNSRALRRASPSHASLQTTQHDIVAAVMGSADTVEDAKQRTLDAIERVVAAVEDAKTAAAKNAAAHIEDGMTLLTHDYSTTLIEAIDIAVERGAELEVYVTEARPRVLGRKAARELGAYDEIEVHLTVDGACGYYLPECDAVFLGMACIVDGTLYNRVGTYPVVATAADVGVPVTVVGSSAKVVTEGFHFENDFRATSEVIREPPEGFTVDNPSYDATPTRLLDKLITDEGVTDY